MPISTQGFPFLALVEVARLAEVVLGEEREDVVGHHLQAGMVPDLTFTGRHLDHPHDLLVAHHRLGEVVVAEAVEVDTGVAQRARTRHGPDLGLLCNEDAAEAVGVQTAIAAGLALAAELDDTDETKPTRYHNV